MEHISIHKHPMVKPEPNTDCWSVGENARRMTVPVKLDGMEEYMSKLKKVELKMDELEQAIKELNESDITIKVN